MNGTTSKNPRLKGQAAVALASAAGVILASRMSRTGLLLTAGAAWWLLRRSARPEAPLEDRPEDLAPDAPAAADAPPVFPPAPARQEGPDEGLWSELRAAIHPAAGGDGVPPEAAAGAGDVQDGPDSAPAGQ